MIIIDELVNLGCSSNMFCLGSIISIYRSFVNSDVQQIGRLGRITDVLADVVNKLIQIAPHVLTGRDNHINYSTARIEGINPIVII